MLENVRLRGEFKTPKTAKKGNVDSGVPSAASSSKRFVPGGFEAARANPNVKTPQDLIKATSGGTL